MQKILLLFLILSLSKGFTCTDFILTDQTNNSVVGRSMEFGLPLHSKISIHPSGETVTTKVFNNQPGMTWRSNYTYMGLTAFNTDFLVDGMNEKGLSFAALWFPEAKYPALKKSRLAQTLPLEQLGSYLLGNFSSINEVKIAIKSLDIWPHKILQLGEIPPLHFSMHDRKGQSIVIEFLDGKMEILKNTIGVVTNSPNFSWHLTNLKNYINLKSLNSSHTKFDGTVLTPTGEGSGLLGLPGDWTPPSRFVRLAMLKNIISPVKNINQNVNLAFHLLNSVDIPHGAIKSQKGDYDYTQWVVVKDLKNARMHIKTYLDMDIKTVNLQKFKTKKTTLLLRGTSVD